jgi:hypothetical protein
MSIHNLIRCLEGAAEKFGGDTVCQVWISVPSGESMTSRNLPEFATVDGLPSEPKSVAIDFTGTVEGG